MDKIPMVAHESMLARQERTIRRMFIIVILLIVLLVGTNAAWIWYESQFEEQETSISQEVDSGDGAAYVAGIGDVSVGESQANS